MLWGLLAASRATHWNGANWAIMIILYTMSAKNFSLLSWHVM